MNVHIEGEETKITMTQTERRYLDRAKQVLKAYARVTPSIEQAERLAGAVEEIGKVLAGTSEEAMAKG